MDEAPPPLAEELFTALAAGLIRKGLLDESDIEAMCAGLTEDAAHQLRCCLIEAAAPTQSEWAAEQARRGFRVIRNDGGAG